jgi:predicted DNA-binding protein (MmcQ/YjbR family)
LRFAATLPQARSYVQWRNVRVFAIGETRRMFALFLPDDAPTEFWCKVDDFRWLELTDRPGFAPAPYLARARWVACIDPGALPAAEARDLLARSHALVCASLPLRTRRALHLPAGAA